MRLDQRLLASLLLAPSFCLAIFFTLGIAKERAILNSSTLYYNARGGTSKLAAAARAAGSSLSVRPLMEERETRLSTPSGSILGPVEVATYLDRHTATRPSFLRGLRASLIAFSLQLLVLLYRRTLTPYAVLFVPAGLLVALAYTVPCLTCGYTSPTSLAPTAAVITLTAAGLVLAAQQHCPRWLIQLLLLVFLLAPVAQAYLLWEKPVLCPLCLGLAGIFAVLAWALNKLLDHKSLPGLSRRSRLGYASLCGAALVLQGGRFALPSQLPSYLSEQQIQSTLVGSQISAITRTPGLAGEVVLLDKEGCPACTRAKTQLVIERAPFRQLNACEFLEKDGCFDSDKTAVGFPTILFVDQAGVIDSVQVGWPEVPGDALDLIERIRSWRKQ